MIKSASATARADNHPPADGRTVEVADLVKRYPRRAENAVDGMSFTVEPGEIFGLLGPNGAGKSTTVGVLTTRIRPTSGRAIVAGVDVLAHPVAARAVIGVVPQRNNLDRSLSIRHNLIFHATYHGVSYGAAKHRADELLAAFGLAGRMEDKPDVYSGGESQRVMIARALMHDPAVLFLDEPTTGLDPVARLFVWDRVRELRGRGTTVVLTTHNMEEAEALADRVGIVDHGRLLTLGSPQALVGTLPGSATLEVTVAIPGDAGPLASALKALTAVNQAEIIGADDETARIRLYVAADPAPLIPAVSDVIRSVGGRVTQVGIGTPSLEDVFLQLTGRTLR
jgi:ABC-2 type transport system ATP-binding protein